MRSRSSAERGRLQTCQNADGRVAAPEALRPWLGGLERPTAA